MRRGPDAGGRHAERGERLHDAGVAGEPAGHADALLYLDYGPCDSDRRHIFNLSATAQTPDFSGAAMRAVASGWRLSGIFRALSGSPFSVTPDSIAR